MAVRILTLDQSGAWSDIVRSFTGTDVYFTPEYCRAFYENGDGEPMVFYMEDEGGRVANVFLLRDMHRDPHLTGAVPPETCYDISSVYGYGGPLTDIRDLALLRVNFDREFTAFCKSRSIIADFVRFHCLLENQRLFEGIYDIEKVRTTVYIDLRNGEQYLWDDFDCKCRNNIRKARNCEITVEHGRDRQMIDDFAALYRQTMDRDHAGRYYYFNDLFFYTTMDRMKDSALLFAAKLGEQTVASAMVIYGDELAHIHFAASDSRYLSMRPNSMLFYEIARWAFREGKKILHIGGGAADDEDELFRFKKTFSKGNRLDFLVGRRIYDESAYEEIVRLRAANDSSFDPDTKYFPKYRG